MTRGLTGSGPAVRLAGATVGYGPEPVWRGLDLELAPGELLAVLGPNGSGKTTLLKVLLGLLPLSSGIAEIAGKPARRGSARVGYVPQQLGFDPDLPVRGRDLVALGLNGHRFGLPLPSRSARRRVEDAIESVDAGRFADAPVGRCSGGEQQRLRIAQALVGQPAVLLCDEPLLSLDLAQQGAVTALIDRRRRETGIAVVFVTHEINPVLAYVDRVLYLVAGRFATGAPQEVLTTERLSDLYGAPVEVVPDGDRLIVLGGDRLIVLGGDDGHSAEPTGVLPGARPVGGERQ